MACAVIRRTRVFLKWNSRRSRRSTRMESMSKISRSEIPRASAPFPAPPRPSLFFSRSICLYFYLRLFISSPLSPSLSLFLSRSSSIVHDLLSWHYRRGGSRGSGTSSLSGSTSATGIGFFVVIVAVRTANENSRSAADVASDIPRLSSSVCEKFVSFSLYCAVRPA